MHKFHREWEHSIFTCSSLYMSCNSPSLSVIVTEVTGFVITTCGLGSTSDNVTSNTLSGSKALVSSKPDMLNVMFVLVVPASMVDTEFINPSLFTR